MPKIVDALMAMKQDERIRALAYLPGDDLIRALEEKYLYYEWMVDSVKCAISQPLFKEEDIKREETDLTKLANKLTEEIGNGKETE